MDRREQWCSIKNEGSYMAYIFLPITHITEHPLCKIKVPYANFNQSFYDYINSTQYVTNAAGSGSVSRSMFREMQEGFMKTQANSGLLPAADLIGTSQELRGATGVELRRLFDRSSAWRKFRCLYSPMCHFSRSVSRGR